MEKSLVKGISVINVNPKEEVYILTKEVPDNIDINTPWSVCYEKDCHLEKVNILGINIYNCNHPFEFKKVTYTVSFVDDFMPREVFIKKCFLTRYALKTGEPVEPDEWSAKTIADMCNAELTFTEDSGFNRTFKVPDETCTTKGFPYSCNSDVYLLSVNRLHPNVQFYTKDLVSPCNVYKTLKDAIDSCYENLLVKTGENEEERISLKEI